MPGTFGGSIEQQGVPQSLWDIPRFLRDAQEFSATSDLSPTVATPAQWSLWSNSGVAYCFSIKFTTDTAMKILLGRVTANPNLGQNLTPNSLNLVATGSNMNPKAAVIALVPPANTMQSYFVPANGYIDLVAPGWIGVTAARGIIISTPLVAANCNLTFYWCEAPN